MSVGTGIFLSTLLILLAIGFRSINGRSFLKTLAFLLVGGCSLAVGMAALGRLADYWSNMPRSARTMGEIALGSDEADVLIAKGEPNLKFPVDGDYVLRYTDSNKSIEVEARIHEGIVLSITSYSREKSYNETGIYVGMNEAELLNKAGPPTKEKKYPNQYSKLLSFDSLNIATVIERGTIRAIIVTRNPSSIYLEASRKEDRIR